MVHDDLSGAELLAIYGDDERMSAFIPDMQRRMRKAMASRKRNVPYSKPIQYMKKTYRLHGEDEELGSFLPGLMKPLKKVGKFTSKVTGGIARAVGIPKGALDFMAKFDPTRKGGGGVRAAVASIVPSDVSSFITSVLPGGKAVVPVTKEAAGIDTKKILIIGGSAAGALVLLTVSLRSGRRKTT